MLRPGVAAIGVGGLTFFVYVVTMSRTISFIDNGELAATVSTLGIAHPTGYPLFSLLGRLAVLIPFPLDTLLRVNLFGALLTSAACSMFVLLLHIIAKSHHVFPFRSDTDGQGEKHVRGVAFIGGALVLGFVNVVWMQSTSLEVYSLHLFLVMVIIASFIRGLQSQIEYRSAQSKWLFAFAFFLGLGFANHMTTLLLVPGCIYLYGVTLGFRKDSLLRALKLSPAFLLGLSPYLYLPVRAAAKPPLMWGYPVTLERLAWHISGKQYRSWIFSSVESAARQLGYFVGNLTTEFHVVALIVAIVGMIVILSQRKRLWTFLALLFLGCVGYAINYDIHDIDSYFLLAYVVIAILFTFGLVEILRRVRERWQTRGLVVGALVCMVFPGLQVFQNWSGVDQSDATLVSDYTSSVFSELDTNAVVLTYQWDYFVSPSLYEQYVGGVRSDVTIIDKELLRRSWYFVQIERNDPEVLKDLAVPVDRFLDELYKFEHDLPYDGSIIERRYRELIDGIILQNIGHRPVYLGPEMEAYFGSQFERVPEGLFYRLVMPGEEAILDSIPQPTIPARELNRLERGLLRQYANALTYRSFWLKNKGNDVEAAFAARRALNIDPSHGAAAAILRELGR